MNVLLYEVSRGQWRGSDSVRLYLLCAASTTRMHCVPSVYAMYVMHTHMYVLYTMNHPE